MESSSSDQRERVDSLRAVARFGSRSYLVSISLEHYPSNPSQPFRYGRRIYWSASGALLARRLT